tara:strand:+ start:723 stop:1088 length:366 start_codon:yes stop_codon:yes gene_type:complete
VNSRLISTWKSSPSNDLACRKELIEHLHIAENIKPSQIIWLLENLTFKVSDVTKKWVDENISKPIFKAGFIAKIKMVLIKLHLLLDRRYWLALKQWAYLMRIRLVGLIQNILQLKQTQEIG